MEERAASVASAAGGFGGGFGGGKRKGGKSGKGGKMGKSGKAGKASSAASSDAASAAATATSSTVFEERDARFRLSFRRAAEGSRLLLHLASRDASEVWALPFMAAAGDDLAPETERRRWASGEASGGAWHCLAAREARLVYTADYGVRPRVRRIGGGGAGGGAGGADAAADERKAKQAAQLAEKEARKTLDPARMFSGARARRVAQSLSRRACG